MAFTWDMPASARRHLEAANVLSEHRKNDVAGYLFGVAAECAIKAMMQDARIPVLPKEKRRDDPYFAHFPELRTMLRDMQLGRSATPLMKYIADDSFMNNWSTDMRYSHGREILDRWVSTWAEQARQAVASIGT
jgi:hypothetical protein